MQLFRSISDSPTFNCALEEYLLTERLNDVLLLYRNRPSVIVGRNQHIEAEVDTNYCRLNGIAVVRRMSGGGTVYHDPGNINYAFITNKGERSLLDSAPTQPVIAALKLFGIVAETGARKEITVDGRKVSGTASHIARQRQLFHGTLLFDTDLSALDQALRGDTATRGKKVASVPSTVMNLSELPGMAFTTAEFEDQLIRFFLAHYNTSCEILSEEEIEKVCVIERLKYQNLITEKQTTASRTS